MRENLHVPNFQFIGVLHLRIGKAQRLLGNKGHKETRNISKFHAEKFLKFSKSTQKHPVAYELTPQTVLRQTNNFKSQWVFPSAEAISLVLAEVDTVCRREWRLAKNSI